MIIIIIKRANKISIISPYLFAENRVSKQRYKGEFGRNGGLNWANDGIRNLDESDYFCQKCIN